MKFSNLYCIIILSLIACSGKELRDESGITGTDTLRNAEYPMLIDSGKKIVYQFSKMTPRGIRFFLDTVVNTEGLSIASLKADYLFPLSVSESERQNAPVIIGVSLPGYFEETIIGVIDKRQLRINYRASEMFLTTQNENFNINNPMMQLSFEKDAIMITLDAKLSATPTGTHLAGKGTLKVFEHEQMMQQVEVFIVSNNALK